MARMPRLVVPGYPHHVTQRGNRRMKTFFSPDDYRLYLGLLAAHMKAAGISVWAYCLMPNHVHFVVVPKQEDSLARLFRNVHRRYSRHINRRQEWQGHLWQERFHSFVMDERYLLATVRYVELNPVRAGLCDTPQAWPWSSARAHLQGSDDQISVVEPMLSRVDNWSVFLSQSTTEAQLANIRKHASSGRPAGEAPFIKCVEELTGRVLRKRKTGPQANN